MQRPVMDPMFLQDRPAEPRRSVRWLAVALTATGRGLRWVGRKLLSQPFKLRRRAKAAFDDETATGRIARGLAYRLLFLPILLALVSAGVVFVQTHPLVRAADEDTPTNHNVYYDPITYASEDGTQLQAWVVPVVDARRVNLYRDRLLHERHPAVVLVHDFSRTPAQMMPLLAPLHEDGFVVVAVGLRGVGAGRAKGQTFGVNEAQDVAATVQMLRRRAFVDPDRIAVVGVGTGANAAMLAARRDPKLTALVLADPVVSPDAAVARYVGPDRWGIRWVQVLNKWTFQVAYRVDLDEMNLERVNGVAAARPVLRMDGRTDAEGRFQPTAVEQVRAFCRANLVPPAKATIPTKAVAGTGGTAMAP